ncbi:flagellar assembly protein T N-terminal domain-containing protein [Dongshaea marina]|uniref:flagellar assembly protein T N-terminal domain-containing protein n=1 Tax=Dongshaea marina TaxID=2047966 RepID=UPI001F36190B|nr:flagella assembly protein FlgT [Dongshaea marina]
MFMQSAYAAWFQGVGSAPIINGDKAFAREQAMRLALKQALLKSGSSISSLQQVEDGILTQDTIQIRSNSEIRGYEITWERVINGNMLIGVQADITPELSSCKGPSYAKSLVLARFRTENPTQARNGQLFELNRAISGYLHQLLAESTADLVTHPWLDHNLNLNPDKILTRQDRNPEQLLSIGRNSDSQYVLFGVIRDIALLDKSRLSLTVPETWLNRDAWLDKVRIDKRSLALQVYLYDSYHGTLEMERLYQFTQKWDFNDTAKVDVYSNNFWSSKFGQTTAQLLDQVQMDVLDFLKCRKPQGRIIRVSGEKLEINLGRRHGLKVGDKLRINHQASFIDQSGLFRDLQRPIRAQMEVAHLQEYSATLVPVNKYPATNIQIRDLTLID